MPPPWRGRLYYALGGTLPDVHQQWVSRDLTAPGWRNRSARRTTAAALPFALVFLLLPGPVGLRVSIAVFLVVAGVGMGYAMSGYLRNRRLVAHGFAPVLRREEDEWDDPPGP